MHKVFILKNKSNTLLINYNNRGLLLDTGYDYEDTNKIIQYLKNEHIKLETVIVSHYHKDHIQGVGLLKKAFPNAQFFSSAVTKFIYENQWFESALYENLIDVSHNIEVEFSVIDNNYIFGDINIEILKSNGHCYGNLIIKFDNYLFCPDIIISNKMNLPFLTDISSYFSEIEQLKNLNDITNVVLTHDLNTMSLNNFHVALNNTKEIIDKSINNILDLIGEESEFNALIETAISTNNHTTCFNPNMSIEQYGYTMYTIKNILKYLENKNKIKLLYEKNKLIIEGVIL